MPASTSRLPAQPDERLIYARTADGHDEAARPRRTLAQAARRILVLVDGQRRVGDLSAFARPGEIGPVLAELESQHLIEVCGLADEPTESERRQRAQAEQALLNAAKRMLRGLFAAELGTAGHVWEARVADSVRMEVLRRVLREAVDVVHERNGEAAARRVLAAVRPVFEQARDAAAAARPPRA
ncbi:MAG: hypothetical protein J0H00_17515 [Burkholderiales bacterium]|nr:hypothetical protein [Burkholderiales bacterium]OJX06233.1 MAG: hypothetical protein BGO72_20785 [Burkholderiales bacterium 70-64]